MSRDGSLTPTRDSGVLSPERSMSCSNRTRVSALVRMRRMRLAMIQPTSSTASAAIRRGAKPTRSSHASSIPSR